MDICLNEWYTEKRCEKCGLNYTSYSCFEVLEPKGAVEVINRFDCPNCSLEEKVKKAS